MTLCVNCEVELDEGISVCPLCGNNPQSEYHKDGDKKMDRSGAIQLNRNENRKYLWELCGIFAFSAITVCTIVDLIVSKNIRWSLISDVVVSAAWLILTIYLYTIRKALLTVTLLVLTVLSALFFIDLISRGNHWFVPVGLPITVAFFLAVAVIMILYRIANFKGLNIISFFFIVLSGLCVLIEMILDKFLIGHVELRWSLIASVSILPVAVIIFYFHYRLKKGKRLDSFLHI
jgi:ABC-type transport system involved in cytochrome c biogenesis permease subunit